MSQNDAPNNNNNSPVTRSQNDPSHTVVTKLCHIIKRPDFDGYGFNLHSEKSKPGQYIGKVDANSPAEVAGLKEGDRILKVNGVSIDNESHKQVVQRIKAIANEVRLLLIDVSGESNNKTASGTTAQNTNGNQKNIAETHSPIDQQNSSNGTKTQNSDDVNITVRTLAPNAATVSPQTMPMPSDVIADRANDSSVNATPNKAGSLQLPITAAEMRAKLLSKKKYDPKNESVDLKKKFEIIQKL